MTKAIFKKRDSSTQQVRLHQEHELHFIGHEMMLTGHLTVNHDDTQ